jgi:hypothetical protein
MFRKKLRITILGFINLGVLHAAHRGYILINGEQFPQNKRGFFALSLVSRNLYQVEKYIPLVSNS